MYDARVVHSNRDRVVELDLSGRLHVLATERSRDGVWFTAWLTDAEVTAAGRTELEPTDQAFAIHVSPSGELQLRAPRHWHPDHGAWLPQQPTELQRAFVTLAHALFPPPPPTRRTRRWMTVRPMPLGTWFADARRNGRTVTVTRGPAPDEVPDGGDATSTLQHSGVTHTFDRLGRMTSAGWIDQHEDHGFEASLALVTEPASTTLAGEAPEIDPTALPLYVGSGSAACRIDPDGPLDWEATLACDPATAWVILLPWASSRPDRDAFAAAVASDVDRVAQFLLARDPTSVWARCHEIPGALFRHIFDAYDTYAELMEGAESCRNGPPAFEAIRRQALRELVADIPRGVETGGLVREIPGDLPAETHALLRELIARRLDTHGMDDTAIDLLTWTLERGPADEAIDRERAALAGLPADARALAALALRDQDAWRTEDWLEPPSTWTTLDACQADVATLVRSEQADVDEAWLALRDCDPNLHGHALLYAVIRLGPDGMDLASRAGDLPLASRLAAPGRFKEEVDCDVHGGVVAFQSRFGMAWGDVRRRTYGLRVRCAR